MKMLGGGVSKKDEKLLSKVKRDKYTSSAGFGATYYGGEHKFRFNDKYFSYKEKIIMMVKKIIQTITIKFGPKSKLIASQATIKDKLSRLKDVKSVNITRDCLPIERPTVDLQPSFNEILNRFNYIIKKPDTYASTWGDNDFLHDGFIGTSNAAHRALSSIITLMGAADYSLYRKDIPQIMDTAREEKRFIFDLYDDKDNVNHYTVGVGIKSYTFTSSNDIVKFCNDRLIALGTITKALNTGNKQLQLFQSKISNIEGMPEKALKAATWSTEEYQYLIKGIGIITNKIVSDCLGIIDAALAASTNESAIIHCNLHIV